MERLAALEQQHVIASERLPARSNVIADAQRRLDTLNTDLTTHNTEVHAFIEHHKVAAACIRASRASWSNENAFSTEVSLPSRVGAALCGVALLNGDFAGEVRFVTEKLSEADARVKDLKAQMDAARRTIDNEGVELQRDQNTADGIAAEIAGIRQQLSAE
jgi:hypothetical protein